MNQNNKLNINHTSNSKCTAFVNWFFTNKNVYVKNLITKEVSWVTVTEYIIQRKRNNLVMIAQINCKKIK